MFLPIFVCLFNCTPPVVVTVEAQGTSAPTAGTKILLVPADPRIPTTDPTYAYLAKVVARGLAKKGLEPVETGQGGAKVVAIGWRRDQPKVTTREIAGGFYSPDLPSQQTEIGNLVQGPDGASSLRDALNPGLRDAHAATIVKTTIYPWTIQLQGRDAPAEGATSSAWTLTLTAASSSPRNDPAEIVPQMIAAGLPFIGASARKDVRVSVNDPAVRAVVEEPAKPGRDK